MFTGVANEFFIPISMPQKSCIKSSITCTKWLEICLKKIYMNREKAGRAFHTKTTCYRCQIKSDFCLFPFSTFSLLDFIKCRRHFLWSLCISSRRKWERSLMAREESQYLCISSECDPVFLLFPISTSFAHLD